MSSRLEIGSSPSCDICISDAGVAEIHAVMYLADNMLCMELLPGRRAILNGNEVMGRFWLRSGDEVWMGQTRLDIIEIFDRLGGIPTEGFIMDEDDASDAVEVRTNWWPFFWVILILLAVSLAFYPKYRDYIREKAEQEREFFIQDSIRREQQRKLYELEKKKDSVERRLDSLNSYQ